MKIIIYILLSILLTEPACPQTPSQSQFQPRSATVLRNQVNIRAGGGLNFEVLGQLDKAVSVLVIDEKYGWYKIKLPDEALSFVYQDYVRQGIVTADKLRVRAGCGSNFNVLGILKKGQSVNVLSREGDWLRIIPPENCSGWVKKDYLRLSEKRLKTSLNSEHPAPAVKAKVTLNIAPQADRAAAREKKIEVQGTIEDLGKIFNRPGTHKLTRDKQVLYYLKSNSLNLNHYVYQNVCVIGALVDTEGARYPVINVEQLKAGQ